MSSNLDLIRRTYATDPDEKMAALRDAADPDIEWTEAEGFPYAGTYRGLDAITAGVFARLGSEWENYRADVHTYLADGDHVAAVGFYTGTYRETGKSMRSPFAHLYQFKDGKIIRMTQYVDTVLVARAIG